MGRGLADAGVNIVFLVSQVIGRRFTAVFGFENDALADTAMKAIRAAARPAARRARKRRR